MYIGFDHLSVEKGYIGPCHFDFYGRLVPNHAKGTFRFRGRTNSIAEIEESVLSMYDDRQRVDRSLLIRRIGLCANKVARDPGIYQMDLFTDHARLEREKHLQRAVLEIKTRYGANALLRGMNFLEGGRTMERNLQIGGHRA